jgi:Domain of unknown function (DUF2024)
VLAFLNRQHPAILVASKHPSMKLFIITWLLALATAATAQSNLSHQTASNMKVAVWDTYVKGQQGHVLHFDIIVPEALKDSATVFSFGKKYLETMGEPSASLSTQECQFCHIEAPSNDIVQDIQANGYHILEMDPIPATLPANPSRRDLIMHLRGHSAQFRFANFQGMTEDSLRKLVAELK